jgi:uncharacterized protein (TIGR03086 family)
MEPPPGSVGLLAGAVRYARGSLGCVTPAMLRRPTPCEAWDLAALLQHVGDSLAAIHEGIASGSVGPGNATAPAGPARLIAAVRDRAYRLEAACAAASRGDQPVAVADRRLAGDVVAAVGAVEIAVHGWDIARACGRGRPIPPVLASGILNVVPLVVTDAVRDRRFGPPVTVSPQAAPGDRLVALLGRSPC